MSRKNLQQRSQANPNRANPSKLNGEVGIGLNAIEELINHAPHRLKQVYFADLKERSQRVKNLADKLRDHNVEFEELAPHRLSDLCAGIEHQGAIAILKERVFPKLDQLLTKLKEKPRSKLVILDSVLDPHNFGAIARVAECFAVDALLWPKNRSCGITPVVSKTSAGAIHLLECLALSNLVEGMRRIKEAGFWIVGASTAHGAKSLDEFEFPDHCALLLGSEGHGIQDLAERELDFKVWIPMPGRIASLNVAQAAAVLLAAASKNPGHPNI